MLAQPRHLSRASRRRRGSHGRPWETPSLYLPGTTRARSRPSPGTTPGRGPARRHSPRARRQRMLSPRPPTSPPTVRPVGPYEIRGMNSVLETRAVTPSPWSSRSETAAPIPTYAPAAAACSTRCARGAALRHLDQRRIAPAREPGAVHRRASRTGRPRAPRPDDVARCMRRARPVSPPPHGLSRGKRAWSASRPAPRRAPGEHRRRGAGRAGSHDEDVVTLHVPDRRRRAAATQLVIVIVVATRHGDVDHRAMVLAPTGSRLDERIGGRDERRARRSP